MTVPAHDQRVTNRYTISYPQHEPREGDPHYRDFRAFHDRTRRDPALYRCQWAVRVQDATSCSSGPLELHHSHIEFALAAGVDLRHLAAVYPGVDNPEEVGAWVESAANLLWLCARHHRATDAGIHHLSASDYEASAFLQRGVIH